MTYEGEWVHHEMRVEGGNVLSTRDYEVLSHLPPTSLSYAS